ncbi:MAG: hypothetical protein NC321_13165 [Clostridium sp.]|nr:hypothetical protein [Clostridium sp.]
MLRKYTIDKYIAVFLILALALVPAFCGLYTVKLIGKIITYMILALALDVLWGYGGLMNLGFAVFFGVGGYIFGICLSCQNGLPAFMQSGGLTEVPKLYKPLLNIPFAFLMAVVIPAVMALIMGCFIFTSKIKGVFYNLITLAFAALFELFIQTNQAYTGGSSGINGIAKGLSQITLFGSALSIINWYYIVFGALVLVYILCLYLTESRFGKVIKSIRDNETRLQFLGYHPAVFKMALFCITSALAGFAGALYIPMTSFISIENVGVSFSTMLLIWLAVGGRGNLTGAMLGALVVSLLQSRLSSILGNTWHLILGLVLVLIVVILPKGIIGTLADRQYNSRITRMLDAEKKEEAV